MKIIIFPLKKGFPDILQAILLVSPSLSTVFHESTPTHCPYFCSDAAHQIPSIFILVSFNSWIKHKLINPGENLGRSHTICLKLDCLSSTKLVFMVQNSVSHHAWSLTNVCFLRVRLEAWDKFLQTCTLVGRMGMTHLLSPHTWHLMWNIILAKLA